METKPTNPKDMVAVHKIPYHLVPPSLRVYAAIGFAEGAFKYGAYNWRVAGARNSVYYSALLRHLDKWWNGENEDPATKVPHLANASSCLGILIDGELQGTAIDDRPPKQHRFSEMIDGYQEKIKFLAGLFEGMNPHHHTELDKIGSHHESKG